jgi:hypothetical protein
MPRKAGLMCVLVSGGFKPGDLPPSGYGAWHEWAGVQYKAGLRQSRCDVCRKWKFPQEEHAHDTG